MRRAQRNGSLRHPFEKRSATLRLFSKPQALGFCWGLVPLLLAGCGADPAAQSMSEDASAPDAAADSSTSDSGPEASDATDSSTSALVFAVNPVQNPPPPQRVQLQGVGEDVDGALTSSIDAQGIRKLRVRSCADNGETHTAPGMGKVRTCTLVSRANRETNQSFEYDDWTDDASGKPNRTDAFVEANAYYHANKIYSFITSDAVGVFKDLPGRHEVNGKKVPFDIVVNYLQPAPMSSPKLEYAEMAFFIPRENGKQGMWAVQGLSGIEGDVLVLGQGPTMDFGYDGETIYHEFGHAINHATAGLGMVTVDKYGLNNMGWALDEGIADTFAFLVSKQAQLYGYLNKYSAGFSRPMDNANVFPADFEGMSVRDGLVIAGANWQARTVLAQAGITDEVFARVLLHALIAMASSSGDNTFKQYGDEFLAALAADGHAELVDSVRNVFASRGLFEPVRAKDFARYSGEQGQMLWLASAGDFPWATNMLVREGTEVTRIAPAYVQGYLSMPQGTSTLSITGMASISPMNMTPNGEVKLALFLRAEQPIQYEGPDAEHAYTVAKDAVLLPVEEASQSASQVTWTVQGLAPGNRYYLQIVNMGNADALLRAIAVSTR